MLQFVLIASLQYFMTKMTRIRDLLNKWRTTEKECQNALFFNSITDT